MSKKIYYKSEVMTELNAALVEGIRGVIYDKNSSNERKLAIIEGMLAMIINADGYLNDEDGN